MKEHTSSAINTKETPKNGPMVIRGNKDRGLNPTAARIMILQKSIGNRSVQDIFRSGLVQAKFSVGAPDDIRENEADRIADNVMRMPESAAGISKTSPMARNSMRGEHSPADRMSGKEEISRSDEGGTHTPDVSSSVASGIDSLSRGGRSLSDSERAFFEPRFGKDLSGVRLHTDSRSGELANELQAKAFTVGNDVVFGSGHYNPGTASGRNLMAHELAHVLQHDNSNIAAMSYGHCIRREADIKLAPTGLSCILKTGPGHSSGVDVMFSVGKATISSTSKTDIATFAGNWISNGAKNAVFVDGYSSTEGAQSVNWRLSCERATAVKTELIKAGVAADKITTFAHGESTEFSTSDLNPNRRAVISTLPATTPPTPPPVLPPQPSSAILKNIKFTSDHGTLVDNNSDWSDSGTAYSEPEWAINPATNNPISQTKDTSPTVDVTINIGTPGQKFDLVGLGVGGNEVSFTKKGITSTGSDQVVSITADGKLPDAVSQLTRFITWKVRVKNRDILAGFSGPHKIYVTYGTPTGGKPTEKRMAWSTSLARGKSSTADIADAIGPEAVSHAHFGSNFNLANPWTALVTKSDCGTLSTLMKRSLEILGVTGAEIRFVYPCHSDWTHLWSYLTTANETKGSGIKLGFISGAWNNYEGTCYFNAKWWMGGAGDFKSKPVDVLYRWTLPNNNSFGQRQVWSDDESTPISYPPGTP